MRAAPALQITLIRFRAWHTALSVLACLGLACLSAWAWLRPEPLAASALGGVGLAMLACIATAGSARGRAASLAWDGQAWHLGAPACAPDARVRGRVSVQIDLGHWMLLRYRPDRGGSHSTVWLPVQRSDLASAWHALRCAVYAPDRPLDSAGSPGRDPA